jgi:hypothetical protein
MPSFKLDVVASGDTTLISATAGRKIRVLGWLIHNANTTVTIKFKSASTDLTGPMTLPASGQSIAPQCPLNMASYNAWIETATGEALVINLSAGVQVSGVILYEVAN